MVHVDPHGQQLLEDAVRCMDEDGSFRLAPSRKCRVVDPA
jgi:hypothetical protein